MQHMANFNHLLLLCSYPTKHLKFHLLQSYQTLAFTATEVNPGRNCYVLPILNQT